MSTDVHYYPHSCKAYAVHGIRNDDLETKVTFPEALEAFCKWIIKQIELAGAEAGTKHYPGIASDQHHHNYLNLQF